MRAKILNGVALWTFLVTLFFLFGCSDDDNYKDVDGQIPTIDLAAEHIQSEPGRKVTISGTVKDNDGLRSIHLQNSDLHLDKTIDLVKLYQETLYSYDLSYNYTPDEDIIKGESFPILITVTDLGGRTTESTVLLTLDGDFTNPTFTLTPDASLIVLFTAGTETTDLDLHFTVSDNKGLDYVQIAVPELNNYSLQVDAEGKKVLDHEFALTFPSEVGTYNLTLSAVDKFANESTITCVITVTDVTDFNKMYLADVSTAVDLTSDLFGVPMLIEHSGEYQYTAHYYSAKAGTQVRFIPQKSSFTPICFGVDPNDETKLINDVNSKPIVLSEVGYYEIKFNVWTGEYSVNTYVPTDAPVAETVAIGDDIVEMQVSLCGSGLPGVGSWDTRDTFVLTRDANNAYLFYGEMSLTSNTVVEFTITPKDLVHSGDKGGWWVTPYWRFESGDNDSGENEYNTYNGGNNMSKVTVQTSGTYRFEFDSHLLRSKFYLVK